MAGQRIDMMELHTLIRLKQKKLSNRKIALALGVDRKTIDAYVSRFKVLELDYAALSGLSEKDLLDLFTLDSQTEKARYEQLTSYFSYFKKELSKPGGTLQALHREYLDSHPQGYRSTQFALHFRSWLGKTNAGGKLTHKAGEKLFIDFCGKKLCYVDRESGEVIYVEVFVAILPCSQYTYVTACRSQKREDLIGCLRDCLAFMDGVPQAIVPDNLKAAVTRAHKYAPVINKTLKDFARHYDCVVDPARPYEPQDKALAEGAVKLVYQRIYYPLSKQTFFSLEDLKKAISEKLTAYNDYLFSHGGSTRRQEFLDIEKELLLPLPEQIYHIREYARAKVQGSSHVFMNKDKNYYSVPCRYTGLHVQLQYNLDTVEIFHNYERIATHGRCYKAGVYTTIKEHMPAGNRFYSKWTPAFFEERAKQIGPSTTAYIHRMLNQYSYPEHGYKQSQGILSLAGQYNQSSRGLDRNTFEQLLGLGFLQRKENIIFTGLTGTGKSHLAQCIGVQACRMLHKTLFFKVGTLFEKAKLSKMEGSYMKWMNAISKCPLLIIDDFGTVPIDQQSRNLLMEIIDQRYETASTIITSQIPVSGWHSLFGDPTIGDAILDRLVYSSHRVELEGESLRKKKKIG